jgi:hypothetical protein
MPSLTGPSESSQFKLQKEVMSETAPVFYSRGRKAVSLL